ncbi:MAG: precorrin-6A reductase [Firmicutes bacterium HGW-Firmicutes-1]|jgi:precorrin-6A/cobalt-precorrin-6A reductase|nr:MAG: precorrin-6A reductase [Firmicutes bacterium HGW-Firmicutes-1]
MILLLGGTGDSVKLAQRLFELTNQFILSTATEYGENLARQSFKGLVISGQMDYEALKQFCQIHSIAHIVDATHPYAQIISENAMKVCTDIQISYYRYERPSSIEGRIDNGDVIYCKDYETAGKIVDAGEGNVLITTGSRQIEKFVQEVKDSKRLYARILPKSEHLIKLERLNFLPDQIIAMKGPFSLEMNKLMLSQIKAKYLITKESGVQGNTDEKLQAAKELDVQVIIIKRPDIEYPIVCSTIDEMVNLVKNRL